MMKALREPLILPHSLRVGAPFPPPLMPRLDRSEETTQYRRQLTIEISGDATPVCLRP